MADNRNHHSANVPFPACRQIYIEDSIPERKALTLAGRCEMQHTDNIVFHFWHTEIKTFTVFTGSEKWLVGVWMKYWLRVRNECNSCCSAFHLDVCCSRVTMKCDHCPVTAVTCTWGCGCSRERFLNVIMQEALSEKHSLQFLIVSSFLLHWVLNHHTLWQTC